MATDKTTWWCLPPEIQNEIVSLLPALGGSQLATVSRIWRSIIEPLNFAEITLTALCLADPESQTILFRKRNQIRYIWFRVELKQYDCSKCWNGNQNSWDLDDIDNQFIVDALESLFMALSAWEPRGNLVLDISIYSPSDNQHSFKYLSFCSDTSLYECPPCHPNDPDHGWFTGELINFPDEYTINLTFEKIMGEGPFDNEEAEMQWWRSLPLVPVVGVVLLRQQTRRRWKPVALANMLSRFPNMKELCYEPWREWSGAETQTDECNQTLIESFSLTKLGRLTIFENFNESYPVVFYGCSELRVPSAAVSQKLAHASLHLTMLSASFMADAGHFFAACRDLWTWDKLTSLTLTSRVLTDDADPSDINKMLRDAAAAALKMPRLDTMELWNGRWDVAMLFRYQMAQDGPIITVRGTSELALGTTVLQAWDAVANRHGHGKVTVQTSRIGPDGIYCHGDAIRQLRLLTQVVRPVSLRQIIDESRIRDMWFL
ncbi:hypothetical protein ACHAPO_001362 [Fusarium lateritium]